MKERLIIKNFGPIKFIDIELRKVNIFIGEQGTGKSTIAKLIAIFKENEFIENPKNGIEVFRSFRIDGFFQANSEIKFVSDNYTIFIKNDKINLRTKAVLKPFLRKLVVLNKKIIDSKDTSSISSFVEERGEIKSKINSLKGLYSYIPAERMLNSLINESFYTLAKNKVSLPKYILEFGESFTFAKRTKKKFSLPFGNYKFYHDGENDFLQLNDLKVIKYLEASSGFLSVTPLMVVITQQASSGKYHGIFIVEEPELNLFPYSQSEVLKEIVSSCLKYDDKLLVTTHSPYILTSLNNLMYSWKIGQKKSKEVNKLIEKKYWLRPDDVGAYMMLLNGKCEDIMDRDEGLIKADKIDGVSTLLNEQFDSLLNIEFTDK